jgi:hypothetical protein
MLSYVYCLRLLLLLTYSSVTNYRLNTTKTFFVTALVGIANANYVSQCF